MTIADLDDFLSLHTDPEVIRFLGEVDVQLASTRLETDARLWNDRGHGLFKVVHRRARRQS
jgi:hypothetical protein